MDSIDRLNAILGTAVPGGTIARISVSPWTWILLHSGAAERWIVFMAFTLEELGGRTIGIPIMVDEMQEDAFLLWDGDGRLLEAIPED